MAKKKQSATNKKAKKAEKHIDINELSLEEIDIISQEIGEKVRMVCDESAEKINKITAKYGMIAKIGIAFEPLVKEEASDEHSESDLTSEK